MAIASNHLPAARTIRSFPFALDAAVVAVAGSALALGASWLGRHLAIDATVLRTVGVLLLPWAGWVAGVSLRPRLWSMRTVIVGNLLWAAGSIVVLIAGTLTPNAIGAALIVLQALAVVALAGWQILASRSSIVVRR
ncbi:MAG: hypothetical protein WBA46_08475 [Thermomicrobiales bacterium]